MGFVPWIPAIVAAGGSLIQGLRGRGEAKEKRREDDRLNALRRALIDHYLDRRGLRQRLPPALLKALFQSPGVGSIPGLSGTLLQSLLSGARYAPSLGGGTTGGTPAGSGTGWNP